jgi:hypothetical protein
VHRGVLASKPSAPVRSVPSMKGNRRCPIVPTAPTRLARPTRF